VPADFRGDGPVTDPNIIETAMQLSISMEQTPQPTEPSTAAADEMKTAFQERLQYLATVDNAYQETRRIQLSTINSCWKIKTALHRLRLSASTSPGCEVLGK